MQNYYVIPGRGLDSLFDELRKEGYELVGPAVQEGVITLDRIERSGDLPAGYSDEQNGGQYRLLKKTGSPALFQYAAPAQSWKRFLFPPRTTLWRTSPDGAGMMSIQENGDAAPRYAMIGVRACELKAIQIQDKVFLEGAYVDPVYKARREQVFIVGVNCGAPGGTCFCDSMGTGPRLGGGFDLALTEVCAKNAHYFVAEAGSAKGEAVLETLSLAKASKEQVSAAEKLVEKARKNMGRRMETDGLRELLWANAESSHWDDVSRRCLACANCTMVCPTCFCSTVKDHTELTSPDAWRTRVWDSCFTMEYSYIHGGSIRKSGAARYRQWITHKLASWHDQFGVSGCVGCGRCITWCPVGIDITEEVQTLRVSKGGEAGAKRGTGN